MERIKINDGTKTYQIVNQEDQELGVFRFNPSDVGIVERYNSVIQSLEETFATLNKGDESDLIAASGSIRKKMDDLFGCDTSSFWEICSPLAPLQDGRLYVESVLEGVGVVIEAETNQRLEKIKRHMGKYTDGYKK